MCPSEENIHSNIFFFSFRGEANIPYGIIILCTYWRRVFIALRIPQNLNNNLRKKMHSKAKRVFDLVCHCQTFQSQEGIIILTMMPYECRVQRLLQKAILSYYFFKIIYPWDAKSLLVSLLLVGLDSKSKLYVENSEKRSNFIKCCDTQMRFLGGKCFF